MQALRCAAWRAKEREGVWRVNEAAGRHEPVSARPSQDVRVDFIICLDPTRFVGWQIRII